MHRIDLTRADSEPVAFRERLPLPGEQPEEVVAVGDVEIEGVLEKAGNGYRVAGELRGEARLECSRCLVEFPFAFTERFNVSLMPASSAPRDEETRLGRGDLDVVFYDVPVLDLAALAAEQFSLALPMVPVCTDACKGLCPSCGGNRNDQPCDCQPGGDERWAPLLDWRTRD